MNVSKNLAYLFMALAATSWATSGTFTELATGADATPMQITVFSVIITTVLVLIGVLAFDRKSLTVHRKDIIPLIVFSQITSTFFSLAWYFCVDMTGVAIAVILLYAYPSIVTVASVFFLSERLTREKAIALPLTFIGCILVAGAQDMGEALEFDLVGIGLGIYTAIAGAIYYIWGKKFLDKYSANTVVLYMYIFSVPSLVLIANPASVAHTSLPADAWWYIFLIGLIPGAIAPVVSMLALRRIQASRASIVASIEPVVAVVIAYLILSETITLIQGIGVGLVFLGVVMLRLRSSGSEEEPGKIPVETPPVR
jgi:drug/metabolite transporter (DMT)-like permease